MANYYRQQPGKEWTFYSKYEQREVSGVLPLNFGESNAFAYWLSSNNVERGGYWACREFRKNYLKDRRIRKDKPRPRTRIYQEPGSQYTFVDRRTKETDTVILPSIRGESNDFVSWESKTDCLYGGFWQSRKLKRHRDNLRRAGGGPLGLLSRMRAILAVQKRYSKAVGYTQPNVTPEQMVVQWEAQDGKCVACGGLLQPLLMIDNRKKSGAAYDHDHETGEGRGFTHRGCNLIEGLFVKMSNEEVSNYVSWIMKIHGRNQ